MVTSTMTMAPTTPWINLVAILTNPQDAAWGQMGDQGLMCIRLARSCPVAGLLVLPYWAVELMGDVTPTKMGRS